MPLRPIYYDTETTGLQPGKDRIIEIAAYDALRDKMFHQLVNPGCPIPAESVAICGITDNMVSSAPAFADIAPLLVDFCGSDAVLIAHNNDKFDKSFLEAEFTRCGIPIPKWRYVDTILWLRKYRPDLPSYALQAIREEYGFEANQAHRAADDVRTLHSICTVVFDDLPIEEVLRLLHQPRELNRMPFGKYQGRSLNEVPRSYFAWLKDNGALDKSEHKELKEALVKLELIK